MQQPVDHPAEPCTEEFREPAPPWKRHTLPSIRTLERPHRGQSVRWTYAEVYQHLFGRYKAFHRIRDGSRQVQSDPLLALLSTSSSSSSSSTAAAAPPSPPPLCRRAPLPGNVHRMSKESVYDSIGTLESGSVSVTPYSDEAHTVLYAYDNRIQIGSVPVKIYDTNDSDDDGNEKRESYVTPDGMVSSKEYLDQIFPLNETDTSSRATYRDQNRGGDKHDPEFPATGYVDIKIYDVNNNSNDNDNDSDSDSVALGITDSIEYIDQQEGLSVEDQPTAWL